MTRPLRIEYPGALYHVTSRGDRRDRIYRDDTDHLVWLDILDKACSRHNFLVHSFCLMPNHYHLLLETVDGNLSRGMRQLNGDYSQYFNRRHEVVGHLFQGRYKAILVQRKRYLLELSRYIVLNPVRAKLVGTPNDWRWSSHHNLIGAMDPPRWLMTTSLLAHFGATRNEALLAYADFLLAGIGSPSPLAYTRNQLILGDDDFIERHKQPRSDELPEIARAQRRTVALSLPEYQKRYPNRHLAMAQAYLSTAFTMAEIAAHFKVSYRTVSRAVARLDSEQA